MHDNPGAIEFDQRTVCFGPLQRHIHDQSRRLAVVEQMVYFVTEFEEAAVIASDGGVLQGEFSSDCAVCLLRVVPYDEPLSSTCLEIS